jgi:ketosteroid isomerase-like protein
MSEPDNFLAKTLARHVAAVEAAHNGDPSPFLDMWSTKDPVTLLGARGPGLSGWEQVTRRQRSVFSRFSNGTPVDFELVATDLSGDLAYTVGYERSSLSVEGGPVELNTLRVTHIYRRENGDWKLVHRHADPAGNTG